MTFYKTLDDVITSTNANTAILRNLLNNTENVTLRSDDLTLIPAPNYDDAADTWTVYQNIPNGEGVCEGVYRLPNDTNCIRLEIINL